MSMASFRAHFPARRNSHSSGSFLGGSDLADMREGKARGSEQRAYGYKYQAGTRTLLTLCHGGKVPLRSR